jgi:hypothetical protein
MSGAIAPMPTDYRGIRFRSKSEAIIARAMDLIEVDWEYEPEGYFGNEDDDYVPDFLLRLGDEEFLIEYKPRKATDASIERLGRIHNDHPTPLALLWLDPFDATTLGAVFFISATIQGTKRRHIKNVIWNFATGIKDVIAQARSHRFDLR